MNKRGVLNHIPEATHRCKRQPVLPVRSRRVAADAKVHATWQSMTVELAARKRNQRTGGQALGRS